MSQASEIVVTNIKFEPVNGATSHIGFVSFKTLGFVFNKVGVHRLLNAKKHMRIRLLYPKSSCPTDRETQATIDEEVNAYLISQGLI